MMDRLDTYRAALLLAAVLASTVVGAQTAAEFHVDKRYVHVQAGQSLPALVQALFPSHGRYWEEITRAFRELNPAVRNSDMLIAGSQLEIPEKLRAIGKVTDLTGAALARNFLGTPRRITLGDDVLVGDRLETGSEAHVQVTAEDDARVLVRPNSTVRFVEYALRPNDDNQSLLELLRGGMRSITGRIGHRTPDRFRLVTPVATIGIRGTDFGVRLCARGECQVSPGLEVTAAPGLYVSVLEGEIQLSSRPASTRVVRGDYYYVQTRDSVPQRLYEQPRLVFSEPELVTLSQAAPAAAEQPPKASGAGPLAALLLLLSLVVSRRRTTRAGAA